VPVVLAIFESCAYCSGVKCTSMLAGLGKLRPAVNSLAESLVPSISRTSLLTGRTVRDGAPLVSSVHLLIVYVPHLNRGPVQITAIYSRRLETDMSDPDCHSVASPLAGSDASKPFRWVRRHPISAATRGARTGMPLGPGT
jgi:hypothetical protein